MPAGTDLNGARVICVSGSRLLLVEHHDRERDVRYWIPPGGGLEPGETLEDAAVRETLEETGIAIRILRRLRIPAGAPGRHALFLAAPLSGGEPAPKVDVAGERLLTKAAWVPVSREAPLGPLEPERWAHAAGPIRSLLAKPG